MTLTAVSRNVSIVLTVLLLHIGFIYGLYSGLLLRAVDLVVPVAMLSVLVEPPVPKQVPSPKPALPLPPLPLVPPVPPPTLAPQIKKAVTKAPAVLAPLPAAISDPTAAPNAPTGSTAPQPAPTSIAAQVTAATASSNASPNASPNVSSVAAQVAAAPAAVPAVQLPSSDADYLQNPKPAYPSISRRMNEQGKTMIRVLIGTDGQPQRAEIGKSSGFSRLDEAALATVMRWRFVPGKRGGVAEAMWFNVPINWVLE